MIDFGKTPSWVIFGDCCCNCEHNRPLYQHGNHHNIIGHVCLGYLDVERCEEEKGNPRKSEIGAIKHYPHGMCELHKRIPGSNICAIKRKIAI